MEDDKGRSSDGYRIQYALRTNRFSRDYSSTHKMELKCGYFGCTVARNEWQVTGVTVPASAGDTAIFWKKLLLA